MARPESIALGGYFAFPSQHIPALAALLHGEAALAALSSGDSIAVIDPCAADGAAIFGILDALFSIIPKGALGKTQIELYACELEQSRHATLAKVAKERYGWNADSRIPNGDMFRLEVSRDRGYSTATGAHLLYLNPPYDPDREYGRLEHRFLVRATPWLGVGGVLVFVVPHYALSASASFIATHYEDVACYKLPEPEFSVFKQVVLIGKRRQYALTGDTTGHPIAQQVQDWAADAANVSVLPFVGMATPIPLPTLRGAGFAKWTLAPLDLTATREQARPWVAGMAGKAQPIRSVGVERTIYDLIGRVHPVAMPLKPGHIAQALASGMLNGKRITPDHPNVGMPALLIKGVFEREYKTVEKRVNKKTGETTAMVQVQQPRLRVTVLDLDAYMYHDLPAGTDPTGATVLADMNIADVLANYRASLAGVLAQQCPPLHHSGDIQHKMMLPDLARVPFYAQSHVAQAALKLIGQGVNPWVLGQVGTGKSLISQLIAFALSPLHIDTTRAELKRLGLSTSGLRPVRNVLVMCPPHLLTSWRNEVRDTLPGAKVVVLESPSQVRDQGTSFGTLLDTPGTGMTFFLLSRETAKLGHGMVSGVDGARRCPKCGAVTSASDKELIDTRHVCRSRRLVPADEIAQVVAELAAHILPAVPDSWSARRLAPRNVRVLADRGKMEWVTRACAGSSDGATPTVLLRSVSALTRLLVASLGVVEQRTLAKEMLRAITMLMLSVQYAGRDLVLADIAEQVYRESVALDPKGYGWGSEIRTLVRDLILSMDDAGGQLQGELVTRLRALPIEEAGYGSGTKWSDFDAALNVLRREVVNGTPDAVHGYGGVGKVFTLNSTGERIWQERYDTIHVAGTAACAAKALDSLVGLGEFTMSDECDERLYQSAPQPRRYPLATYIARHTPNLFDLFLLDEGHEYNNDGTAQERAAHRIAALGMPTVVLTGSALNGYASSMFSNLWALSPSFRQEYGRDGKGAFVTRYGYRKQLIELPKDEKDVAKMRRFGSVSDRVDDGEAMAMVRALGEAPGVLPLFLLERLLPMACTIHKEDLDTELPPYEEIPVLLGLDDEAAKVMLKRYESLQREIAEQISKDRFEEGLAGKLFGALGQAITYPDRCHMDTGNTDTKAGRAWVSAYPESAGGAAVATVELFSASVLMPKEEWTLWRIGEELKEGRGVLLFVTNTGKESGLVQRLHRLIVEAHGDVCAILDTGKVNTKQRQNWIDTEVIGRGKKVMIVNPMAIKTGLNNLVPWFSTGIWYQSPNADAITYRQANGRLHRIGQTNPVRVYMPVYAGTAQELAMGLLGRKVAVSTAVDGLDVTSALEAAGAGESDTLNVMDLGRYIFDCLMADTPDFRIAA